MDKPKSRLATWEQESGPAGDKAKKLLCLLSLDLRFIRSHHRVERLNQLSFVDEDAALLRIDSLRLHGQGNLGDPTHFLREPVWARTQSPS